MSISESGKLLAYGLSSGGSDWQEWKVLDVATVLLRVELDRDADGVVGPVALRGHDQHRCIAARAAIEAYRKAIELSAPNAGGLLDRASAYVAIGVRPVGSPSTSDGQAANASATR